MRGRRRILAVLALLALLSALVSRSYYPFRGPVRVLEKDRVGPVCLLLVQPLSARTGEAKGEPERLACGRTAYDAAEPGMIYGCARHRSALIPVSRLYRLTPAEG